MVNASKCGRVAARNVQDCGLFGGERIISANDYVIEYQNELARFHTNPRSVSRHLSRYQRGGLHNLPALATRGGTGFHRGQMLVS